MIDVGASFGAFSTLCLVSQPDVRVLAIEPGCTIPLYASLTGNETHMHGAYGYEVINCAVADREGVRVLVTNPAAPGEATLFPEERNARLDALRKEAERLAQLAANPPAHGQQIDPTETGASTPHAAHHLQRVHHHTIAHNLENRTSIALLINPCPHDDGFWLTSLHVMPLFLSSRPPPSPRFVSDGADTAQRLLSRFAAEDVVRFAQTVRYMPDSWMIGHRHG